MLEAAPLSEPLYLCSGDDRRTSGAPLLTTGFCCMFNGMRGGRVDCMVSEGIEKVEYVLW